MNKDMLVIVTPVYEDGEVAKQLFRELAATFDRNVYVVAVDDGSVRQPLSITDVEAAELEGVVIKLKRNVGHQRAIAIGLNYVAENITDAGKVVVMDSDGEDIPASIKELLKPLASGDIDLVVAERKSRRENALFRFFYSIYKLLFRLLSGRRIKFGNFMVLKPAAVKRLTAMQELWIHVAACALTSKLRIAYCALDRGPRYGGVSKMNFVALVLHGFKALMVFAEDVLVRVGIGCSLVAVLSILASGVAIALKILGFATPGWFSVALGLLFLVFLQTGALTLITLMMTGVVKGGTIAAVNYEDFIDEVQHAR